MLPSDQALIRPLLTETDLLERCEVPQGSWTSDRGARDPSAVPQQQAALSVDEQSPLATPSAAHSMGVALMRAEAAAGSTVGTGLGRTRPAATWTAHAAIAAAAT